jgi:ATP-binding cassette subfamily C protein
MGTKADGRFAEAFAHLRKGVIYAGFLSFFIAALQMTVPLFMLQVYDRVLNSRSLDTLMMLVLVAVGGLIVLGLLDFVRSRVFLVLSESLTRRLSLPVTRAAMERHLAGEADAPAQASRDVGELRSFLANPSAAAPLEALWSPLFLVVLFLLHPLFGLLALISGVVLVALGFLADLLTRRPLSEAHAAAGRASAETAAAVRHAEAIDALGMLPALGRRWQKVQGRMLRLTDEGQCRGRALAALTRSARMGMQVAVIALGAVLVIDRQITAGSLIAAAILMGRFLAPFEQLISGWRQWVLAAGAWRRIRTLLEERADRRQTMSFPRPDGRLSVDRLVYVPPGSEQPVLKGVSFAIEPGDSLGVVGPSAAGKSTLARLLVGVLEPTRGGVFLDGHSVFQWERDDFGGHVGYLPQSVSLMDGTVRENIARMADADPMAVVEAARRAGVHEMIGRLPFGYDTPVGDAGFSLSGGQRQRIALARALFGDPSFIVLDEPNSNLDSDGEQALLTSLADAKARGATIVLVAHRPSIMSAVDKLLVLNDGQIERFGDRAEVLRAITRSSVRQIGSAGDGGAERLPAPAVEAGA